MATKKRYSKEEVIKIVYESENRASPENSQPGHTLKQHLLISDQSLTDRIIPKMGSNDGRTPILIDPDGKMVSKDDHKTIWQTNDPGISNNQFRTAFRNLFENAPQCAGAFEDIQDIGVIGKYVLNSQEGQDKLAQLDAGATRIRIKHSLRWLDRIDGAFKMRVQTRGVTSDICIEDVCEVFMMVDKINANAIHIQTFYPIK